MTRIGVHAWKNSLSGLTSYEEACLRLYTSPQQCTETSDIWDVVAFLFVLLSWEWINHGQYIIESWYLKTTGGLIAVYLTKHGSPGCNNSISWQQRQDINPTQGHHLIWFPIIYSSKMQSHLLLQLGLKLTTPHCRCSCLHQTKSLALLALSCRAVKVEFHGSICSPSSLTLLCEYCPATGYDRLVNTWLRLAIKQHNCILKWKKKYFSHSLKCLSGSRLMQRCYQTLMKC